MYYIVYLPEKLGLTGKYNKQFQCKSMFNGFTGPIRYSEEEAEQDGEFHQRLLIAAYPELISLCNSNSNCEDSKSLNIVPNKKVNITPPTVPSFNPNTVTIGNTIWMAENLKYDDGGKGIFYNPENKEYYYTWEAAVRVAKKLGWKLPSDKDWNKACEACGGIKDDEKVWYTYDDCSLKESLNIKLAGYCYEGSYNPVGSDGYFWSVSEYSSSFAWYRHFDTSASIARYYEYKTCGCSLRLVKDS